MQCRADCLCANLVERDVFVFFFAPSFHMSIHTTRTSMEKPSAVPAGLKRYENVVCYLADFGVTVPRASVLFESFFCPLTSNDVTKIMTTDTE